VEALAPWIEDVDVRVAGEPLVVLPPDPATTLVWRITAAGESGLLVAGPRTKAAYHAGKELPVCVRLRIRPGRVTPLLAVGADELVDRVVPLNELWGSEADALAEELLHLRDCPRRAVDLLGMRLLTKLPDRVPGRFDLVGAAVTDLAAARSVGETAARLGVSDRYLRRVFHQAVGVSPKHFARIARVRLLLSGRDSWSNLAASGGYADQSHLIADFRSLMRVTPAAYASGRVPVTYC
jgi:AraC-like DNA-binding protein